MFLRSGSRKIFYTIRQAKIDNPRRVFILFHGLGTDHRHGLLSFLAQRLAGLGTVILFDYQGYGQSGRGVSYRKVSSFLQDARAVTRFVRSMPQFHSQEIYFVGHSIGAIIAEKLAAGMGRALRGLVMIAGNAESDRVYRHYLESGDVKEYAKFSTLFGRHQLAQDFWADRHTFEPIKIAYKIAVPTLLIYGGKDLVNPVADGRKILKALRGKKKLAIVPSAQHNFHKMSEKTAVIKYITSWLKKS